MVMGMARMVRMVRMERLLRRVLMLVDGELPLLLRPVAADGLHRQLLLRRLRLRLDGARNLRLRFKLRLPMRVATGDSSQLQLLKARRLSNQDGVLLLKDSKALLLRVLLLLSLPDGALLLKVSKALLLRVHLLLNHPDGVLLLKASKALLLRVHLLFSLPDGVPLLQLFNLPRLVAGVLQQQLPLPRSTTTIITDGDLRRLVAPDGKVSEVTLDRDRPIDLHCFPCSFLGT
jgi:hypothetical protein